MLRTPGQLVAHPLSFPDARRVYRYRVTCDFFQGGFFDMVWRLQGRADPR